MIGKNSKCQRGRYHKKGGVKMDCEHEILEMIESGRCSTSGYRGLAFQGFEAHLAHKEFEESVREGPIHSPRLV